VTDHPRTGDGLLTGITGLVITLPDGAHVLGQTTWRLFNAAARALAASPIAAEDPE
jgi:hypothetical protein